MKFERLPPILTTLQPSNHPYLNGAWTPLHEEADAWDLEVIAGAIPTDIDGVYIRNTENQIHQPLGRFHPFDGDGMLHQIDFKDGRAGYRNRWVRTRGMQAEQEAGGDIDARSDVFAFGAVVYECLVGMPPPFARSSAANRPSARPGRDAIPPSTGSGVHPAIRVLPAPWQAFVSRATAPDPADRFPDARSMAHALRDLAGLPSTSLLPDAGSARDR